MKYNDLSVESRSKLDDLGIALSSEFFDNEKLRKDKEDEWVSALRQCKGLYSPEIIALLKGSSEVYVKYVRYKESMLRSTLNNILLSDNDKNWEIKPTTKPNLSKRILNEINDSLIMIKKQRLLSENKSPDNITDEEIKPTIDEFESAVIQYATARSEKMGLEIEDQLTDMKYNYIQKAIIKSGIRFGTGILEGPFSNKIHDVKYEETKKGFRAVKSVKYIPSGESVRIWDWYPDMSVTELEDCDFVWKRLILNKSQMRELAKKEDFISDVILDYIKDKPHGNADYKKWELDIETIENLPNKSQDSRKGKYEVLSRWGNIEHEFLEASGIKIGEKDVRDEYFANIWLLGNHIIKIILSPLPDAISSLSDIYHVFYFEKDESSIFGTGLPKISYDMEMTMCGSIRASLNNGALVAGPQTEVNVDLLAPGEDPQDISPRRVWLRTGRGVDAQYRAINPITFNSNITDLLSIFDKALQIADLEICIPMWMHTEPEKIKEQTLSEIATKWSLHTVNIKDIVKSYDDCNEGFLTSMYHWNMEFNKDNNIKGDFNVRAKGSTALLMKELKMQAMNYFTQTLRPEERIYIKTKKLLEERMRLFVESDIKEFINTDEEVEAIRASMRDEEMLALAKDAERAKIFYDMSKAEHMKAKAAKTIKDSDLETIKTLSE